MPAGKSYGDRPPLVIAPHIYPELDAFLTTWRAELGPPTHGLLFSQKRGGPLGSGTLYDMVTQTAYRLSGKRTNPHLIRDMVRPCAGIQNNPAGPPHLPLHILHP
jgi:hypothetical protein